MLYDLCHMIYDVTSSDAKITKDIVHKCIAIGTDQQNQITCYNYMSIHYCKSHRLTSSVW